MSRADAGNRNVSQARNFSQNRGSGAYSRPSQAQVQQFMQQRPGSQQQSGRQPLQQLGQAARTSPQFDRANVQSQLQRYTQNGPLATSASQQSLRNQLPQLSQTNAQAAAQAARQFSQNHPNDSNWFNGNFFNGRRFDPGYNPNLNLWDNAGWARAAAWAGVASTAYGYPAYYYDSSGLYTSLTPEEAATYAPQPQQSIASTPQATSTYQSAQTSATQGDWLPLGVFALGPNAAQAPYSNMVIQLALGKDGTISGTYYNVTTNQTYQIVGLVDKSTQKAVFQLSEDPQSPVATTGLYNLTQDLVQLQVHFPDGSEQAKVLVRLKQQ